MLTSIRLRLRRFPRPPKPGTDDYERIKVGHFGEIVLVPTFGGEWLARWEKTGMRWYPGSEDEAREAALLVARDAVLTAARAVKRAMGR